ncbi:hypothetical protein [Brevibacterium sp. CFH 10365]|uniref:hypothetical protein n=1 Tax=Brevibacterium sp. CFH 10365 TaxID=2585207 RepID=UPI0012664023|nr:hypothetical protein [Brevibacterium sp. CFH 10365]
MRNDKAESTLAQRDDILPTEHGRSFMVTAAVTIIDRSNTEVEAKSFDDAIRLIRRRYHPTPPVVELARVHTNDTDCFDPRKWVITPTEFRELDNDEAETVRATYRFKYVDYSVIVPGEGSFRTHRTTLEGVVAAAQALSNRELSEIELTSHLPGLKARTLEPQHFEDAAVESAPEPPSAPPRRERLRPRKFEPVTNRLNSITTAIAARRPSKSKPKPKAPKETTRQTSTRPGFTLDRKWIPIVIALALVAVIIVLIPLLVRNSGNEAEPVSAPVWATTIAPATPNSTPLLDGYDNEAWSLPAGKADAASAFAAGVAYVASDPRELVLLDTSSGKELGKTGLDSSISYTSEFMAGDVPAVAARTEKSLTAITVKGDTQAWKIAKDDTVRITGTTPMVVSKDGKVSALIVGKDKPVAVTRDTSFIPTAIDGKTLIQADSARPQVVIDPLDDKTDAKTLDLPAPTDSATFSRHISSGHGVTVAEWTVEGQPTVTVHDLDDDAAITAAFPLSDDADADSWQVGRAMGTGIIGDKAVNLADGSLNADGNGTPFTTALGPLAVAEAKGQRTYFDATSTYPEPDQARLLGYTDKGPAIVRNPDGSITALTNTEGK